MSIRSQRSPKGANFSRSGFLPIAQGNNMSHHTGDATIDIPLNPMMTNDREDEATLRGQSSSSALRPSSPSKEKTAYFRGYRRRRRHDDDDVRRTGQVGYDGEEDSINAMGRLYKRIRDASVFTRYLLYVIPLGACIAVPIVVGATAAPHAKIGGVRILWFFVWVEAVWAALWVSKLLAHILPNLFEVFAGFVSSGVRKYSLVIRSLEIPLSLVGWAVAALATFKPVMLKNPDIPAHWAVPQWINIVQEILAAATVSSLIFLGEKFIIQLISIDYHRKQFTYRIKESKHNIYLLGLLYEASRTLFPAFCNEFAEDDYLIADQLTTLGIGSSKQRSHVRSGSHTPLRLLQDIGRVGDKLTSAFGQVAHEITGKQIFDPNSAHSVVVQALERPRATEALAKRIWMSFVIDGNESLYPDDLLEVLGPERRSEAEEAFAALDQDGNGDVSLDEMILVVSEFARERKAIARSLHDVAEALKVLDGLFGTVVFIAVVFIFVAFLNHSFVTTLATTGTALLSLSFVFAVTCQEILGSCIFVFVKHPYDVGDRIDIGQDQLVVEHISLLFSVFRRTAGPNIGRMVQIPHILLNTLWIENISRSKAMSEQLEIDVDFGTSFEDVQILKNELTKFVQDKDNSRDFQPDFEVNIIGASDQSKLQLQVQIKHKSNWANEVVRQARRSRFMCALVSALKTVPIYPPGGACDPQGSAQNPSYNVSVTDDEAKQARAAATKAREEKRMVPRKHIEDTKSPISPSRSGGSGPAGFTPHVTKVVDDLTARNPAIDPMRDQTTTWPSTRGTDDEDTLGERPSIDQNDLEEMKSLLRSESSRGKRKPGIDASRSMQAPSVPTIAEPGVYVPTVASNTTTGYQSSGFSSTPTAYRPPMSSGQLPPPPPPTTLQTASHPADPRTSLGSPAVMQQLGRSASNPYRRAEQAAGPSARGQPAASSAGHEPGGENFRPYSGV